MKKVVIFGGSGFIGTSLAQYLISKRLEVVIVGRNQTLQDLAFVKWDGQNLREWTSVLNNAYAIVNLVGKSVDCIKTPENIDEILKSRVDSTKLIGQALRTVEHPPQIWVQMSTAHIYGDSESRWADENSTIGYGLAPYVGQKWEEAFHDSVVPGTRKVILRTGFVLDKTGGAYIKLKQITKLGLGGSVASGKQGMSWIHMLDVNRFIEHALINSRVSGVYNLSAPSPLNNRDFMALLRKALKVPFGLNAPLFAIKIGAKVFFKTDYELLVYGRFVVSKKMEELPFKFKYSNLELALNDLA